MTQEMTKYLETIGITEHYLKRAQEVYDFYSDFLDEDILDIFVSDYIDEEGTRQYESLWMFTKNYIMEAKSFLTKNDFDFTTIKNLVEHWKMEKENYDFKTADDKSRLSLRVTLCAQYTCSFKASKENCDYLREIFMKYIKPNIKNTA